MDWHFLSFLRTQKVQIVEILPQGRQGPIYFAQPIPWQLMSWHGYGDRASAAIALVQSAQIFRYYHGSWCPGDYKETGHQQLWYRFNLPRYPDFLVSPPQCLKCTLLLHIHCYTYFLLKYNVVINQSNNLETEKQNTKQNAFSINMIDAFIQFIKCPHVTNSFNSITFTWSEKTSLYSPYKP